MSTNHTPADERRPAPSLPEDMLIVLPVRNMVMFPGVVLPVAIEREKTVAGAQEAVRTEAKVSFLLQKDPQTEDPGFDVLHRVGTAGSILRYITAPDGGEKVGVFARYNRWDNTAGDDADSVYRQADLGINYWPHPDVVLKADYQNQKVPNGADEFDGFNLAIGYQF